MFENLVESGSHKQDLSRKSSFILGTVAIYAVLGLAFIIGSIWFTVAQLDTGDLELTTLVAPVPVPQQAQGSRQGSCGTQVGRTALLGATHRSELPESRAYREQPAGAPGRRKLDRYIDWALSHPIVRTGRGNGGNRYYRFPHSPSTTAAGCSQHES